MSKLLASKRVRIFVIIVIALLVLGALGGSLASALKGGPILPPSLSNLLSVPKPAPQLPGETLVNVVNTGNPLLDFKITNTMTASWLTMAVILIIAFLATRKMKLVPKGIQNIFEWAIETLYDFVEGIAGKDNARRFFPVVATIFLFILANGLLSFVPGFLTVGLQHGEEIVPLFRNANTDINTPLAIALVSLVFVEYWGISAQGGTKYFGQLFNFKALVKNKGIRGLVDFFVGLLEILTKFIRILSFTFRLFGNMISGEILILLIGFLIPLIAVELVYGLELLVAFIQALIFAALTLVFGVLNTNSAHSEEHE
jgi:F-type H+-transporting ATPase subunit a